MLQVLHDRLLADGLFDPLLRLDAERVRLKSLELPLGFELSRSCLTQQLREAGGVSTGCSSDLWIRLRIVKGGERVNVRCMAGECSGWDGIGTYLL